MMEHFREFSHLNRFLQVALRLRKATDSSKQFLFAHGRNGRLYFKKLHALATVKSLDGPPPDIVDFGGLILASKLRWNQGILFKRIIMRALIIFSLLTLTITPALAMSTKEKVRMLLWMKGIKETSQANAKVITYSEEIERPLRKF